MGVRTRAQIVNRARDQFLAGACFSLDKSSGIRGRDLLNLFKHRFQSRTAAYDLLETCADYGRDRQARVLRQLPRGTSLRTTRLYQGLKLSRAGRTLSSSASSLNGFAINSTAPARNACIRHFLVAMCGDESRPAASNCMSDSRTSVCRNVGLELQAQFERRTLQDSIIFITAHGDEKMRMQALRAGAVEFMAKPFQRRSAARECSGRSGKLSPW